MLREVITISSISYFITFVYLGMLISPKRKFLGVLFGTLAAAIYGLLRLLSWKRSIFALERILSYVTVFVIGLSMVIVLFGFLELLFRKNNGVFSPQVRIFLGLLIALFLIWSADDIKIVKYDVTLPKGSGKIESMKIAFFSDLHLGAIVKPEKLKVISNKIKERKPDVIFIGGDLFDNGLADCTDEELKEINEILKSLKAPLGVYFINGNHDIIGLNKGKRVDKFVEETGIITLNNKVQILESSVNIIGIDDGKISPIDVINKLVSDKKNTKLPTIVLLHKPLFLKLFKNNDLVLSGHTHRGQIFPANLLLRNVWTNLYGYKIVKGYQSIVSSGAGYWQLPMRLGTFSEIVEINVTFK